MPSPDFSKSLRTKDRCKTVIIAACMFFTCAAALAIAQKLVDHERTAALDALAQRVLLRAGDIADQAGFILLKARRLDAQPCSPRDLDQLRVLSFESRFVRDVVRLENSAITCSAAWGQLAPSFKLPAPHHGIAPYRFWRDINTSPIGDVRSDLTAYGSVGVVTAPGAFDDLGITDPSIQTLVTSRDGSYVFRSFGHAEAVRAFDPPELQDRYVVTHCHGQRSICVVLASARMPVWSESWEWLGLLVIVGTLAGAGLGLMVSGLVSRRNALGAQLQRAIAKDAILVVYQPIRMLADRRLVGVEALARWSDAKGQNIPPDQFIPLAEELGLLDALTRSVLRTTFRELGDRLRAEAPFYVSVNVNSEEMINPGFRAYLDLLRMEHHIPASRLALEVTERSTSDHADLAAAFQAIRDGGYMVMIDDFGTGYSNFAYLAALPLDAIKMDRAFTNAIGTESLASEVIPGIVSIARGLNLVLIVEGIETEAQASYLKTLHPQTRGQGWLLGRPTPALDLPLH